MTINERELYSAVFTLEEASGGRIGVEKRFRAIGHLAIRQIREAIDAMGLLSQVPLQGTIELLLRSEVRPEWFDALLTADQYSRSGEGPERFLMMARVLREEPEAMVAIAADLNNISAANNAGCYVVGLTFEHTHQELYKAGAHTSVRSYLEAANLVIPHFKKQVRV